MKRVNDFNHLTEIESYKLLYCYEQCALLLRWVQVPCVLGEEFNLNLNLRDRK